MNKMQLLNPKLLLAAVFFLFLFTRLYKITEIPTIEPKRIGGTAKLNTIIDGWRILKFVLKERFSA